MRQEIFHELEGGYVTYPGHRYTFKVVASNSRSTRTYTRVRAKGGGSGYEVLTEDGHMAKSTCMVTRINK